MDSLSHSCTHLRPLYTLSIYLWHCCLLNILGVCLKTHIFLLLLQLMLCLCRPLCIIFHYAKQSKKKQKILIEFFSFLSIRLINLFSTIYFFDLELFYDFSVSPLQNYELLFSRHSF